MAGMSRGTRRERSGRKRVLTWHITAFTAPIPPHHWSPLTGLPRYPPRPWHRLLSHGCPRHARQPTQPGHHNPIPTPSAIAISSPSPWPRSTAQPSTGASPTFTNPPCFYKPSRRQSPPGSRPSPSSSPVRPHLSPHARSVHPPHHQEQQEQRANHAAPSPSPVRPSRSWKRASIRWGSAGGGAGFVIASLRLQRALCAVGWMGGRFGVESGWGRADARL